VAEGVGRVRLALALHIFGDSLEKMNMAVIARHREDDHPRAGRLPVRSGRDESRLKQEAEGRKVLPKDRAERKFQVAAKEP
jgi:hypothetical protein